MCLSNASRTNHGCVWKWLVPLNPMVLLIIIPMKNGYFIGNINPTFSDKPRRCSLGMCNFPFSCEAFGSVQFSLWWVKPFLQINGVPVQIEGRLGFFERSVAKKWCDWKECYICAKKLYVQTNIACNTIWRAKKHHVVPRRNIYHVFCVANFIYN